jgi:hypothetical protein
MTETENGLPVARMTPCPHCGQRTPTTSDGVCTECWEPKERPELGVRLVPAERSIRDLLDARKPASLGLVAAAMVGVIAIVVYAVFG